jgi:hypothetical protein
MLFVGSQSQNLLRSKLLCNCRYQKPNLQNAAKGEPDHGPSISFRTTMLVLESHQAEPDLVIYASRHTRADVTQHKAHLSAAE